MSQLQQFLSQLGNVVASCSPENQDTSIQFTQLLSIDISNIQTAQTITSLQSELQSYNNQQLSNLIDSENFFDGDWPAFNGVLESFLKLSRDLEPNSILQSNDLFLTYFNDLTVAVMNNTFGIHIAKLLQNTISYIFPIVKNLDIILNQHIKGKKYKRLIFLSTCLSKLFNHLRSIKGWNSKKALILFIVNKLNKIYFIIDNPLLCANIFTNMNLLNLNFRNFSKFEQCEYRYILGKFYLIKNKLYKSFHHLEWVFMNLHQSDEHNRFKVLRFLIPMSLLVGKIPSKRIINQYPEFNQVYPQLIKHLINGNHLGFQQILYQNQEYFKSHNLLILLSTKIKVIIFKNLIYKILQTSIQFQPNDPNVFKMQYSILSQIFEKSIGSNQQQDSIFGNQHMYKFPIPESRTAQLFFIENVFISLIENDLMKGNILSKIHILILSKKNPFPDVFKLYQDSYGVGYDEKWMDL